MKIPLLLSLSAIWVAGLTKKSTGQGWGARAGEDESDKAYRRKHLESSVKTKFYRETYRGGERSPRHHTTVPTDDTGASNEQGLPHPYVGYTNKEKGSSIKKAPGLAAEGSGAYKGVKIFKFSFSPAAKTCPLKGPLEGCGWRMGNRRNICLYYIIFFQACVTKRLQDYH